MPIYTPEEVKTAEERVDHARTVFASLEADKIILLKAIFSEKTNLEAVRKELVYTQETLEEQVVNKQELADEIEKLKENSLSLTTLLKEKTAENNSKELEIFTSSEDLKEKTDVLRIREQVLEIEKTKFDTQKEKFQVKVDLYNSHLDTIKQLANICHSVQE